MDQVTLRLLARHAQLQRALRHEEPRDVVRAAGRARLAQLDLLPAERAAAKRARAMVGRALREARLRARQPALALPAAVVPAATRIKPGARGDAESSGIPGGDGRTGPRERIGRDR